MAKKPNNKQLVLPWPAKKKIDKIAAAKGRELLNADEGSVIVKYYGKRWCLMKLVQHLAKKVYKLERNQCKPSAKCLFEGREYLEEKYVRKNYEPARLPYEYFEDEY
jgi:hypothetical protein